MRIKLFTPLGDPVRVPLGAAYGAPANWGTVTSKGNILKDLAPEIHRQRLVVEGLCEEHITDEAIREYLTELSGCIGMITLVEPVTHLSPLYGWAGWIHWETSGAHFYAWDVPRRFFSVDVYACKPFDAEKAVDLTQRFFRATTIEFKEF